MPTTSNFGWTTPADTDLVKNGALAIRTLGNGIDTSMAELKGGTTGQVLSKTSNTDMDFTWVTQDDANAIQNSIVDAKGDLITATANDVPARLAVGTNGHVLTADSTTATGLKWAAVAAGGKVLQVVEGVATTTTTVTTGTYTDTGLTATITPSATSSKILVIVTQQGGKTNTRSGSFRLLRGATQLLENVYQWDNGANSDFQAATWACQKLDSPNTTSATTYKTQMFRSNQGSVIAQPHGTNASDSTIILMEIGA